MHRYVCIGLYIQVGQLFQYHSLCGVSTMSDNALALLLANQIGLIHEFKDQMKITHLLKIFATAIMKFCVFNKSQNFHNCRGKIVDHMFFFN